LIIDHAIKFVYSTVDCEIPRYALDDRSLAVDLKQRIMPDPATRAIDRRPIATRNRKWVQAATRWLAARNGANRTRRYVAQKAQAFNVSLATFQGLRKPEVPAVKGQFTFLDCKPKSRFQRLFTWTSKCWGDAPSSK